MIIISRTLLYATSRLQSSYVSEREREKGKDFLIDILSKMNVKDFM